jgi:hypothetical protein
VVSAGSSSSMSTPVTVTLTARSGSAVITSAGSGWGVMTVAPEQAVPLGPLSHTGEGRPLESSARTTRER